MPDGVLRQVLDAGSGTICARCARRDECETASEACVKCNRFDGGAEPRCQSCDWYDEWFGVCCNADSVYCADWPPDWFSQDCDVREVRDERRSVFQ